MYNLREYHIVLCMYVCMQALPQLYLRIAGNITAAVTEDCAYLIVIWSPVDKAQQYYVRVRETGVGIDTATVDDNMYKTSLSSERVKELSIEVYHISTICNNVDFVISQVSAVLDKSPDTQKYSDPITINTKGLHNPTNFEHCVIIVFFKNYVRRQKQSQSNRSKSQRLISVLEWDSPSLSLLWLSPS